MKLTAQILITLAGLLSFTTEVRADAVATCLAGPVATVENTTCSIGDKLFIFGAASFEQPPINGVPTTPQFTFTPDSSNSSNPGFIVTGALSVVGAVVPSTALFNWGAQIETLSGAPTIQGLSTTVSGTTTPGIGLGIRASFSACDANSGTNCVNLEPGSGSQFPCLGPTCTAAGNFSPSIAITNKAFISYFAESLGMGGAVTATGASYYVSQTPVPEPGTLLLLGASLLGVAGIARRKCHR